MARLVFLITAARARLISPHHCAHLVAADHDAAARKHDGGDARADGRGGLIPKGRQRVSARSRETRRGFVVIPAVLVVVIPAVFARLTFPIRAGILRRPSAACGTRVACATRRTSLTRGASGSSRASSARPAATGRISAVRQRASRASSIR